MSNQYGRSRYHYTSLVALLLVACGGTSMGSAEPISPIPRTDRRNQTVEEKRSAAEERRSTIEDADKGDGHAPVQEAIDESLIDAAKKGHWMEVIDAMDDGTNVEGLVGIAGITDLHIACLHGNMYKVEQLIEQGADVSARTDRNETPLHLAALVGAVDVISFLADEGADMNDVDSDDRSVLHWCILGGWAEIVEYLVNVKSIPATFDPSGIYPPLIAAIQSGNIETVKFLVSNGADVGLADAYGVTPLHQAAAGNDLQIATFLISKGAKASVEDGGGKTPLHVLAQDCQIGESCLELARFLVKRGAKRDAIDADGNTAEDYAAKSGDEKMISFLSHSK